jgi:inosine-uridine nucleoside N-ribohydrolase
LSFLFLVGIEFNFACDPLAASIVLEEFKTTIRIVTFELTLMVAIPFEWLESSMFAMKDQNRKARLFYDVTQFLSEYCKNEENNPDLYTGMTACDAVCLACVLDESVIKQKKSVYACVEPFGKVASGHMISDWYGHFKRAANVEIITDIDREKFFELYQLCVKEDNAC